MYFAGIFFIAMSFVVFGDEESRLIEQIGVFLIHAIPGFAIILLNYLLRKKELILGISYTLLAIFFFFFYKYYQDISGNITSILTIVFPILFCGIIFIVSRNRY